MDKAQKQKLDEKINDLAEKLYLLRIRNGSKADQKNLFSKLCEAIIQYIPVLEYKYNRLSTEEIWDHVIDLLYYEFPADHQEKWKPEQGQFAGCFFSLCKLRLKGACKQKSGDQETVQQTVIDPESGEEIDPLAKIADASVRVEDEVQTPMIMKQFIILMSEEVKFKIKAAPNKFCYVQRFYTEWLARQIMKPEFDDVLPLISGVSGGCIDLQFASSFLDQDISTLQEINHRHLKMLSDFTENEKDKSTPCGFDLKNIVYVSYVTMVTGKEISDSIISNHRKNYYELLAMQSERIGISNHPIAES